MIAVVSTLEHALPGIFAARAPAARIERGLRRMDKLTWMLDEMVPMPGTSRRIGIDSLLGLVPGVGDLLSTALQGYVLVEAVRLGVPRGVLVRMLGNVVLDTAIGFVPILGDVFDFYFKAGRRNLRLAQDALKAA
jgi:hypothetical protein